MKDKTNLLQCVVQGTVTSATMLHAVAFRFEISKRLSSSVKVAKLCRVWRKTGVMLGANNSPADF